MCIVLLWWKLSIFTHLLQQRKVKVGNLGQWNSKHTLRLFTFKTAIICYVKGPFFYVSKLYASRSVQFSCSVVSGSLRHHGLQHARLPCLSLTPRACSNSCPLTWWCHPTILCSVIPFSCLPSFPASGSFQMSLFFTSGGQGIGASTSASVLPLNIQDWFPLELTGWISLQCKGLSRVFSNTAVEKYQFFGPQLSLWSNSHIHTWPLEKP